MDIYYTTTILLLSSSVFLNRVIILCWPGAFSNNRISPKFTNESKEEETRKCFLNFTAPSAVT